MLKQFTRHRSRSDERQTWLCPPLIGGSRMHVYCVYDHIFFEIESPFLFDYLRSNTRIKPPSA